MVSLDKIVELAGGRAYLRANKQDLALFCATLHGAGSSCLSVARALRISHRLVMKLAKETPRNVTYNDYRHKLAVKVLEEDEKSAKRRSNRGRKGAQAKPQAAKKALRGKHEIEES